MADPMTRFFPTLRRWVVLLLVLCQVSVAATARAAAGEANPVASPDDAAAFQEANALYARGDFAGARAIYERLVRAGVQDAALFHNLGNAEFRTGQPVQAAINYRRALALDPGHPEARHSFEHVLGKLGSPSPGMGAAEVAGRYVSFDLLALLGSLTFWAGVLGLTWSLFARGRHLLASVLSVLLAMVGATAVAISWAGDSRLALQQTSIVVADATEARTTPADNAQKLSVLPVGTPVRLIAERDGWSLVKLPLGVEGWVKTAALQPLLPPPPSRESPPL